jgi:hypothetical protein
MISETTRSPYLAEVVEGLGSVGQDETPIRDVLGRSTHTGLPKPSRMRAMWREICGDSPLPAAVAINLPLNQQPILAAAVEPASVRPNIVSRISSTGEVHESALCSPPTLDGTSTGLLGPDGTEDTYPMSTRPTASLLQPDAATVWLPTPGSGRPRRLTCGSWALRPTSYEPGPRLGWSPRTMRAL